MTSISVIIPLYNEAENAPLMYDELTKVLAPMNVPYELIFVDDGSKDKTVRGLVSVAKDDPHFFLIEFRRNFGQTAAMAAGLEHSRYEVVITLDGDLQNDPSEIPKMVKKLNEGYDLVAGWRKDRKDKLISRKIPSRLANWLISKITGVSLHDYGCSLKVMTRDIAHGIKLYGEMHRFIPALANQIGAKIYEMPVNHRARQFGESKYGISRTVRVVLDLLTVKFLLGFAKRPIHFFGVIGMLTGGIGFFALAMLVFDKFVMGAAIGNRPMLTLSVMMIIIGIQFLVFGLLAEVLARTYYESQDKKTYVVRKYYSGGSSNQRTGIQGVVEGENWNQQRVQSQ